jgi:hypothetical protein
MITMPNNPSPLKQKRRDDTPDRQTIAAMYALMELHPVQASNRVNTATFQEKVKQEQQKEMALQK